MGSERPKFAVVREDPRIESDLVEKSSAKRVLVVASGGCTALTVDRGFASVHVTAFDLNAAQIAHCKHKETTVDPQRLNVDSDDPRGLNQHGEFEALFRILRQSIEEFVAPREALRRWFDAEHAERLKSLAAWKSNPYWATAFEITFCDALLNTMFGTAATQHADPGSYPGYFQGAFERGLSHPDAHHNPFLQHVLLGMYRPEDAPDYVKAGPAGGVEWLHGDLPSVPALDSYDVVSLSNIFDWSTDDLVRQWSGLLRSELAPGATVLIRQLNNRRNLRTFFEPEFVFDDSLGQSYQEHDRSLFYNRVEVARRA